jgi:hypothetical protein
VNRLEDLSAIHFDWVFLGLSHDHFEDCRQGNVMKVRDCFLGFISSNLLDLLSKKKLQILLPKRSVLKNHSKIRKTQRRFRDFSVNLY